MLRLRHDRTTLRSCLYKQHFTIYYIYNTSLFAKNMFQFAGNQHYSSNRVQLQATAAMLIDQLQNGEPRTEEQHQQMIATARYCLQQLRAQTLESHHAQLRRNSVGSHYNTFSTRYSRVPTSVELSCAYSPGERETLRASSFSASSAQALFAESRARRGFISTTTSSDTIKALSGVNEPPPPYDTLTIKSSCALPPYSHLKNKNTGSSCSSPPTPFLKSSSQEE